MTIKYLYKITFAVLFFRQKDGEHYAAYGSLRTALLRV